MIRCDYIVRDDFKTHKGSVRFPHKTKVDVRKLILEDCGVSEDKVLYLTISKKCHKEYEFSRYKYEVLLGSCALVTEGHIIVKDSITNDIESVKREVYNAVKRLCPDEIELSLVTLTKVEKVDLMETVENLGYERWKVIRD